MKKKIKSHLHQINTIKNNTQFHDIILVYLNNLENKATK